VLKWHRQGFRRYWRWRSRLQRPGRPGVNREIRELIQQMGVANPLWGAPRLRLLYADAESNTTDVPIVRVSRCLGVAGCA